MDAKICTSCKKEKSINEYHKKRQTNTGYSYVCKECMRIKNKKYYKKYYEKHKDKIIKCKIISNNKRRKVRKQNDPAYKMQCNLRRRMLLAVNGKRKMSSTFDLIGCTPEFLKDYLKSKFSTGMSWDNYGYEGWHIDHILPCSSFDLTDPEQQKKCFHYTNLQPLWAKDNMSKGDNI